MGVELLLVVKSLKVRLYGQRHDSGRAVGQVVLENFGIHSGGCRCCSGGVDSSQLVAGFQGKAAGARRGGLAAIRSGGSRVEPRHSAAHAADACICVCSRLSPRQRRCQGRTALRQKFYAHTSAGAQQQMQRCEHAQTLAPDLGSHGGRGARLAGRQAGRQAGLSWAGWQRQRNSTRPVRSRGR